MTDDNFSLELLSDRLNDLDVVIPLIMSRGIKTVQLFRVRKNEKTRASMLEMFWGQHTNDNTILKLPYEMTVDMLVPFIKNWVKSLSQSSLPDGDYPREIDIDGDVKAGFMIETGVHGNFYGTMTISAAWTYYHK